MERTQPNAVYNNILTGELIRPHLYAPLHLFVGDGTIKIITAADRGGSAKLRFYNFDVHFLQKASYSAMNLWPVPVPTGVVDRHGHPPIVRQFQIWVLSKTSQ